MRLVGVRRQGGWRGECVYMMALGSDSLVPFPPHSLNYEGRIGPDARDILSRTIKSLTDKTQ